MTKAFAETYSMRSRFFQLLGEAGKLLADAYREADLNNQAAIKELAFDAMQLSLVEHHGYTREELATSRSDPLQVLAFIEARVSMPSEEMRQTWPEWASDVDAAVERYNRESTEHTRFGRGTAYSDVRVGSIGDAIHYWVYLPLIRAALDDPQAPTGST